jgi:hypothetical protein
MRVPGFRRLPPKHLLKPPTRCQRRIAGSLTWIISPQPIYPHQQRAIAAPHRQRWRSPPQGHGELMTEAEDLNFKPPSRLEQIDNKACEQAEERKHQT